MGQDRNCLYVWDTELTVYGGKYHGWHTRTEKQPRYTDAKQSTVRIIQPVKKVEKK